MTIPSPPLHTDWLADQGERVFWACVEMRFGEVTVPANFLSDGLSIPKIAQPIINTSKAPHFIYAGILHDWLYRYDAPKPGMERKCVDKLFKKWMKHYGVGAIKRQTIYLAVRLGGRFSYNKKYARFHEGDHL